MSDEKFSAKFEVKPSAIPDRIIRDFENVKHPSAIKLIPVSKDFKTSNGINKNGGLTMLELNEYINDPFWINVRRTLMILMLLLFIALFIISMLIIVYTPGCHGDQAMTETNSTLSQGVTHGK